MAKTIALIASLDTKKKETFYAASVIQEKGYQTFIMDVSTKDLIEGADISPCDILQRYAMEWNEFESLEKAARINAMSNAAACVLPQLYEEGKFDAVISIGGGQNAKMAAIAMRTLPFGVPKIVASSLACGARTMAQYVGDKDIFVMHTVADISGLNSITKTVIQSVCGAAMGLVEYSKVFSSEPGKIVLGVTELGITAKGTEKSLQIIEKSGLYEPVVFHANGVGGSCMEKLILEGRIDVVLDMNLHEITGEIIGGYCAGAKNRLMTAIEKEIPMVVVPGALDMVDFFIDEQGNGLPADISQRKQVYHNANICHCKVFAKEAEKLAKVVCERLNQAHSPVTLIIPSKGCCEAAAPGGAMYDPEVDKQMVDTFKRMVGKHIKLMVVDANINEEKFSEIVAHEVMMLKKEKI